MTEESENEQRTEKQSREEKAQAGQERKGGGARLGLCPGVQEQGFQEVTGCASARLRGLVRHSYPARLVLFRVKAHSPCATAPEEAPILTRLARAWSRHFPTRCFRLPGIRPDDLSQRT